MFDTLLLSISDSGTAVVTLNRPDVHNAFNAALIADLQQAFTQLGKDDQVRAIILTNAGKNFCAGADLNWMKAAADLSESENVQDALLLAEMLAVMNDCPKPVIAAISGAAMGGGVGLAACADIAIGAPNARFSLSEVKLGLTPATISPYVVAAIGARIARRLFITADLFGADQALEYGLLHEVTDDPLARAQAIADGLKNNAPLAMAEAKKLVFDVQDKPITADLRLMTAERIAARRCTAEGREGLAAFLEKRTPFWRD